MSIESIKIRFIASRACDVAESLMLELNPFCERLELVGSLRRNKKEVGDIELLYIPKIHHTKDLLGHIINVTNRAEMAIDRLLCEHTLEKRPSKIGVFTWGLQNKLARHCASGIPVDLFETDQRRWFVALVIRTGSKDNNVLLATTAQKYQMKLHAYGGIEDLRTGEVVYPQSEKEVFEKCGMPFKIPQQR